MGHLLKITKLGVSFKTSEGRVSAVVEASLDVKRGQRIGIIGESGSGKSLIASGNIIKNAQKQGIFCVAIDSENALHEDWLQALGVDTAPEKMLRINFRK